MHDHFVSSCSQVNLLLDVSCRSKGTGNVLWGCVDLVWHWTPCLHSLFVCRRVALRHGLMRADRRQGSSIHCWSLGDTWGNTCQLESGQGLISLFLSSLPEHTLTHIHTHSFVTHAGLAGQFCHVMVSVVTDFSGSDDESDKTCSSLWMVLELGKVFFSSF